MIIVNAIAVIVYLILAWYLIRTYKEHLVFFGYLSFMLSWTLISCFYNDLGIFNLELYRYTETTYATSRLAGFYIVFNLGFLFMARLLANRPLTRVDYAFSKETLRLGHLKVSLFVAIGLVILYILYSFITEGIPLFSGVNRVEYFKQADIIERNLLVYGSAIAFLLGFYRRRFGRFSVNGLIVAAFCLFAILVGNKFSMLVTLLIAYFAPIYIRYLAEHPRLRLFTWRQLTALASVVGILILLTLGVYLYLLKDVSHASNLLVNRVFVFQGQMWWAVDHDIASDGRYDRDHWKAELDNILSPGDTREGDVGMKYLMVKALGPEKAYEIFDRGYLYTHTYPAILIATFPPAVAVFIQFLAGMAFFMILHYLFYSVLYRHAIRALITMLIISAFIPTLFSGNIAVFLTLGLIVKLAVIIVLELPSGLSASPAK